MQNSLIILIFYNPRHLKKVLNKYRILSLIKVNKSSEFFEYIPNIIADEKGYIFDTIMVLYFIILYELYPDKFYEIKNYDEKISNYVDYLAGDRQSGKALANIKNRIDSDIKINDKNKFLLFKHISVLRFMNRNEGINNKRRLFQFINFFTPKIFKKFEINMNDLTYFDQFEYQGNEILIDFCKYLFDNIEQITMKDQEREYMKDYNLIKLCNMTEMLL